MPPHGTAPDEAVEPAFVLGVEDIYDMVMERLEAVSFAITTRPQRHMTLLQFWLTIMFGASEIGFIAASVATWYYRTGLWTVLAWTVGASLVTGLGLTLMLREKPNELSRLR